MGIPQRMAVAMSGLVIAGAGVLTLGTAAPAGAAVPGAVPAQVATVESSTAQLTPGSSWCSRHPRRCHGFRHHHKFRHHKFRHHGYGHRGWGHGGWGRGINIHNENVNISSSGGRRW